MEKLSCSECVDFKFLLVGAYILFNQYYLYYLFILFIIDASPGVLIF